MAQMLMSVSDETFINDEEDEIKENSD